MRTKPRGKLNKLFLDYWHSCMLRRCVEQIKMNEQMKEDHFFIFEESDIYARELA